MKKILFCFSVLILISCKNQNIKFPIDQGKFRIETLFYEPDGDYKILKFRVSHYYDFLSELELTVDGYDGNSDLIESVKAIEKNIPKGEERIFYIRIKANNIFEIKSRVSNYEL